MTSRREAARADHAALGGGKKRPCVGCQEAEPRIRVPGLGGVCESCAETLDIVFATETGRVVEATARVQAVFTDLGAE